MKTKQNKKERAFSEKNSQVQLLTLKKIIFILYIHEKEKKRKIRAMLVNCIYLYSLLTHSTLLLTNVEKIRNDLNILPINTNKLSQLLKYKKKSSALSLLLLLLVAPFFTSSSLSMS